MLNLVIEQIVPEAILAYSVPYEVRCHRRPSAP